MGVLSWLRGDSERFSMSIGDPAFAAWLRGDSDIDSTEAVTAYTVLGLSAVQRAVSIISSTIASLPLKTYEREGDGLVRVPSVFDDPYPGIEGMTRYAWVETILLHQLLWRKAFLWHEDRDAQGFVRAYRPILPTAFTVKREGGRRVFKYRDPDTNEEREVGSEQVTFIPGPSLDGVDGHPLLYAARYIFSGAISGDRTAAANQRRGVRLAGLVTPAENEDVTPEEGAAILEQLRQQMVGREHAGDIAFLNKSLKLSPWSMTNIESQWHETRQQVTGEVGRLFGVPPHLLGDTEKQTSWGTGVAEQNLGFARYTLMGWTSRIEQVLSLRLPGEQFVEFDYKGLFQGTPEDESRVLIAYKDAGVMTGDEVRRVLNLPPLTPSQRREVAPPTPLPVPQEATA